MGEGVLLVHQVELMAQVPEHLAHGGVVRKHGNRSIGVVEITILKVVGLSSADSLGNSTARHAILRELGDDGFSCLSAGILCAITGLIDVARIVITSEEEVLTRINSVFGFDITKQ